MPEIAPEIEDRLTMLLPAGALLILLEVIHGCGDDARLRDPYMARELRASRCSHLIALIVNLALVALLLYAHRTAALVAVVAAPCCSGCSSPPPSSSGSTNSFSGAASLEPTRRRRPSPSRRRRLPVHSAILSPNPGAGQVAPAGMTPPESRKTTAAKLLRRIVSQAVATQQPLEHVLATSFQQVDEGPEGDRGRFRATFEEITPPPLSVEAPTPAPAPPRLGEVLEEGEEGGSPMVKVRPPSLVARSMAPPSPAREPALTLEADEDVARAVEEAVLALAQPALADGAADGGVGSGGGARRVGPRRRRRRR